MVAPSLNVTVPALTVALLVTVAVNVTAWPKVDGLSDEVNAVVVGAAVLMLRHQPPPIDPLSPLASSSTNSCQTPFGFWPLNVESVVAAEGAGAGAGNGASAASESSSLGR